MIRELNFVNRTRKSEAELRSVRSAIEASVKETKSNGQMPVTVIFERKLNRPPFGNFQERIHPKRFFRDGDYGASFGEMAVDMGRVKEGIDLKPDAKRAVEYLFGKAPIKGIPLERMTTADKSTAWKANSYYWETILLWADFGSQLPTGESDSVNVPFWQDKTAQVLIPGLKQTESRQEHPDQISFLELGAAGGETTEVVLRTLESAAIDDPVLAGLLRKTVIYLADYSKSSIDEARQRFASSAVRVEFLNGDLTHPKESFPELADKQIAFAHAGNLFDNLPTKEVAKRQGRYFEETVCLYLEKGSLPTIGLETGLDEAGLERLMRQVLAHQAPTDEHSIKAWESIWLNAVRFNSDYKEIKTPDAYKVVEGPCAVNLAEIAPLVPEGEEMFLSNHAAYTFGNVLNLMHKDGLVQILDLFQGGRTKLAGSMYHPVNRGVLDVVADKLGFKTTLERFNYNPKSHSSVYTASRKPV